MSAASAATIVNGEFETGDLTDWTVSTTANGTTGVQTVSSFDTTGSGASNAATFRVGQSVFDQGVQEGINLTQSINIASAGLYKFSADVAASNTQVNDNAAGGLFQLFVGGLLLDSADLGFISSGVTLRGSFDAGTALGLGPVDLVIRITRPFTEGLTPQQYVDNVTVTGPHGTPAVPVPTSLPLLAFGIAGLGVMTRRRRAARA